MYIFGSGTAIAKPYGAHAAGNPTPMQLGDLQETSIDIQTGQKELMGKNQYPLAIARTGGKVSIKIKLPNHNAKLWNDIFFGGTVAGGQQIGIIDESHAASASITIDPPGPGVFVSDCGVRNGVTGVQLDKVASSPTLGQYSVNESTGVYTFNASDTSDAKLISYTYSVTGGKRVGIDNLPMGHMPIIDLKIINAQFSNTDGSVNCFIHFPAVIAAKMSLPFKNEDFLVNDIELGAFADAAGKVMYINTDV